MRKRLAIVVAAAVPLLGACQTNEQTGGLFGALGGGALGAAIGGAATHRAGGALIGAGIGALGGYLIGSAIGRALDERDRQIAAQSVQQVLYAPVPPQAYGYAYQPSGPAYEQEPYAPPQQPSPSQRQRRHRPAPQPAANPTTHWTSDHSGASGSATVVAAQKTASGGECRTVHEVAYVSGKELVEDQKYCRTASSEWQKA